MENEICIFYNRIHQLQPMHFAILQPIRGGGQKGKKFSPVVGGRTSPKGFDMDCGGMSSKSSRASMM